MEITRQIKNPLNSVTEGQHGCLGAYHQKLIKGRAVFHGNILHISRYILHQSLFSAASVETSMDPCFPGVPSSLFFNFLILPGKCSVIVVADKASSTAVELAHSPHSQ